MYKKVCLLLVCIMIFGGFTTKKESENLGVNWNDIYFNDELGTYQANRCYQCAYEDAKANPQKYVELNVIDAIEYKATAKGIEVEINNQKFYQLNKDKIKDKQNILGKFNNSAITEQFAAGVYDENKLNNFKLYHTYQMQVELLNNQASNVIKYEDINQEFDYEIKRINGTLESQGFKINDQGKLKVNQKVVKEQLIDYLEICTKNITKLEKEINKFELILKDYNADKKLKNQVDIDKIEKTISTLEQDIKQLEMKINSPKWWQVINQEANNQQLADLKKQVRDYQAILLVLKTNQTATYRATYSEDYAKFIEKQNQINVLKACVKSPQSCIINFINDQDYFKKQIKIDESLTTPKLDKTSDESYQTKITSLEQALINEQQLIKVIEQIQQQIK